MKIFEPEKKIKKNTITGFTLVEVMIVLVILSVMAFFVAPEVMNWRPNMRLTGTAQDFFANMQNAKVAAIEENANVILTARPDGNPGYFVFVDNLTVDQTLTAGEEVIADVDFVEPGGTIDAEVESNSVPDPLIFTPRGLVGAGGGGEIVLRREDDDGAVQEYKRYKVIIGNSGQITLQTKISATKPWE